MTLKFKTEKEYAAWAAKAKPRIKGVAIALPDAKPGPAPKQAPRSWWCKSRRAAAVLVLWSVAATVCLGGYAVLLFVGLLVWRILQPLVQLAVGFFLLCLIFELIMRAGQ